VDIIDAYQQLGSYRAVARLCGCSDKTVKRVLERRERGEFGFQGGSRPLSTEPFMPLIEERVRATDGLISAKRLLPLARAAGYPGSARHFQRAVAKVKANWRRRRRIYRPWLPAPGEHLVIDWAVVGHLFMFCAVLAWSRWRFVRFANDQRRETTLRLLAECFEELAGVPAVVLADRMGCLKTGVVANVVVPHPEYVRFAAHYGFRPDFCEAADPESKGLVENLVGYAKSDLVVPAVGWTKAEAANQDARIWSAEVNARVHSEIKVTPLERLEIERGVLRQLPSLRPPLRNGVPRKVDRLSTVRFGSARYSVPNELVGQEVEVAAEDGQVVVRREQTEVARHPLVAPGEVSIQDEHYGPHRSRPSRSVRPRSLTEHAFLALGPLAERYLRDAAGAGTSRLDSNLAEILELKAAWGEEAVLRALTRALSFRRFRAADVRAILEAGAGVHSPARPGPLLAVDLPAAPLRSLSDYALESLR
jgi:transposase